MTSAVQPPGEPSDGASLTVKSKSIRLERVGRRKRIGWSLVALSVLLVFSALVLLAVNGGLPALRMLVSSLFALAGSTAWTTRIGPALGRSAGERGKVTFAGDEVVVERPSGHERVARTRITGGWREQGPSGRPIAVIQLEGEALLGIEVRNEVAAARVLRAAGADTRAVAMRVGGAGGAMAGCALALVSVFGLGLPVLLFSLLVSTHRPPGDSLYGLLTIFAFGTLGALVMACILVVRMLRTTVIIGTDGILVKPPLGRRQYVPCAELASAHVYEDRTEGPSIVLYRRGGEPIKLSEKDAALRAAVVERIREAMAAGKAAPASADVLSALDRGPRTLEAWREHLRAILQRSAAYRSKTLTSEDVATVVEDPGAEPVQRVAAAAALASTGDPEMARRVRIAAGACANERLRIALDQAAEGELDESLLAEFETRARRRAR